MGSKSSSAPPPDPRLVEAQLRSMGIQDDAITQIMANANEMLPLQKAQTQFALDTAKQAVTDSQADRSWMLTRRNLLSGVQDQLVSDATGFNAKQRSDQLAAEAGADAQAAISQAQDQTARMQARRGVSPFTQRANDPRASLGAAALLAGSKNMARRSARQEGYALTDRASNALAGYPAMGMAATGAGAGFAANGVNIANAGAGGMNAGFGMASDVAARMGANATGMFNAQAQFKSSQDQIAASSNPLNTILGAVAGVGTSWALGSLLPPKR
jgi:hypothetical protein